MLTQKYTQKKNIGYNRLCTKGLKIVLGFSGNYKQRYLLGTEMANQVPILAVKIYQLITMDL